MTHHALLAFYILSLFVGAFGFISSKPGLIAHKTRAEGVGFHLLALFLIWFFIFMILREISP